MSLLNDQTMISTADNTPTRYISAPGVPGLPLSGSTVVNGSFIAYDVTIKQINMAERLDVIEKVLGIPERDAILESKYPQLKEKFNEYVHALEKYRMFERVKGNNQI